MGQPLITRDLEILGGTTVFNGTRVPIRILFEYLEAGDRLTNFLRDFPTVTQRQAVELLERASKNLSQAGDEAAA